jgi:hypothetical protein
MPLSGAPNIYIPDISRVGLTLADRVASAAQTGNAEALSLYQTHVQKAQVVAQLQDTKFQHDLALRNMKLAEGAAARLTASDEGMNQLAGLYDQVQDELGVPKAKRAVFTQLGSAEVKQFALNSAMGMLNHREAQAGRMELKQGTAIQQWYIAVGSSGLSSSAAQFLNSEPWQLSPKDLQTEYNKVVVGTTDVGKFKSLLNRGFLLSGKRPPLLNFAPWQETSMQYVPAAVAGTKDPAVGTASVAAQSASIDSLRQLPPTDQEVKLDTLVRADYYVNLMAEKARQKEEFAKGGGATERKYIPVPPMRGNGTVTQKAVYEQLVGEMADAKTAEEKKALLDLYGITAYTLPYRKLMNDVNAHVEKQGTGTSPNTITRAKYKEFVAKYGQTTADSYLQSRGLNVVE